MNAVHLTGRLTRDPEMRATASSSDICGIRLAVDGPRDADTTFIDVTASGKLAGNCAEYLTQGRPIAVSGRLSYGEWEAEDGSKRSKHEVIAHHQVDFLPDGRQRDAEEPTEDVEHSNADS
jgi:single-strand DNA-binding protein